jgi:hypothetical protein
VTLSHGDFSSLSLSGERSVPVTSLVAVELGPICHTGHPRTLGIPPNDAGSSACTYHITCLVYANSCDGGPDAESYYKASYGA